ncbi:hypothetical protein DID76_01780 [Candidatus Marinamargulisbacteria bacterium SCGC AG-414-C22]|nr:hypothetical protein DID76_01780 [Candidatus Marinamargulisbacteria bacterium SCGC AG-414-C22]
MAKKLLFILTLCLFSTSLSVAKDSTIYVLSINGAIGPAYSHYFINGLTKAQHDQADAVLLTLDTPGGLDKSMRDMIQAILSSPIPVITYITPNGARAASAGTYLLYASHIAAMSPGTHLGAATPVSIAPQPQETPLTNEPDNQQKSSSMENKIINDATAYIEVLADHYGRNKDWAAQAVQDAASLAAKEALTMNVIDYVAEDSQDLLNQCKNHKTIINNASIILNLENPIFISLEPNWKTEFLAIVTSPDIAYLLLICGVYLIIFELSNPGIIIAGTLGTLSLLLSLYGLQMLPVNYVGLLLLFFGIVCVILEVFLTSFGLLAVFGSIVFAMGSFMLIDSPTGLFAINPMLVYIFVGLNALIFIVVLRFIFKIMNKPSSLDQHTLIGKEARCLSSFNKTGQVKIHGEIWNAKTNTPVRKGEYVIIKQINGLTFTVEPKGEK